MPGSHAIPAAVCGAAVLALLWTAACEPSTVEGAVEKYGAAARAKLEALGRLAPLVDQAPPVVADRVAWPAGPVPDATYDDGNLLLIHVEELAHLAVRMRLPVRVNHRAPWVDGSAVLGLQTPAGAGVAADLAYQTGAEKAELVVHTLQRLGRAQYALVVRGLGHQRPQMVSGTTYQPGRYAAEVLVLDLRGPSLLGGFRFEAGSRSSMNTTPGRNQQNLDADLDLSALEALNGALKRNAPALVTAKGGFLNLN